MIELITAFLHMDISVDLSGFKTNMADKYRGNVTSSQANYFLESRKVFHNLFLK